MVTIDNDEITNSNCDDSGYNDDSGDGNNSM